MFVFPQERERSCLYTRYPLLSRIYPLLRPIPSWYCLLLFGRHVTTLEFPAILFRAVSSPVESVNFHISGPFIRDGTPCVATCSMEGLSRVQVSIRPIRRTCQSIIDFGFCLIFTHAEFRVLLGVLSAGFVLVRHPPFSIHLGPGVVPPPPRIAWVLFGVGFLIGGNLMYAPLGHFGNLVISN